jgi:enoyl-CoA hydratase/carnithine racemase
MPDILFETDGPLAFLTINRPQARNAMTPEMDQQLYELCEQVDNDPNLRVLLLRGEGGKSFVAGTDINIFRSFKTGQDALDYEERMHHVRGRLGLMKKPTIALIQGFAVGGGMGMALACDLRIATPDSQIGLPIARTLGNVVAAATIAHLVALIGPARTKEIIFTARLVQADEALRLGLFNEVVEPERLIERGREVALQIAENAPLTIQATQELVRRVLARAADVEDHDLILKTYLSDDFKQGVSAFLEKRKPQWQGR